MDSIDENNPLKFSIRKHSLCRSTRGCHPSDSLQHLSSLSVGGVTLSLVVAFVLVVVTYVALEVNDPSRSNVTSRDFVVAIDSSGERSGSGSMASTFLLPPLQYQWGHAINTKDLLLATLESNPRVNAIEADIIYSEAKQAPVMGHPPIVDSAFTLQEFLSTIVDHGFHSAEKKTILKLDFKSAKAFEAALELMEKYVDTTNFPQGTFINADIFRGPCEGNNCLSKFDATSFVRNATNVKESILSIGWTTDSDPKRTYTVEMIQEMLDMLRSYPNTFVTFPVKATAFKESWNALQHLYDNPKYGVTLWWSQYALDHADLQWIYNTLETNPKYLGRTFYDIKGFDDFYKMYIQSHHPSQ